MFRNAGKTLLNRYSLDNLSGIGTTDRDFEPFRFAIEPAGTLPAKDSSSITRQLLCGNNRNIIKFGWYVQGSCVSPVFALLRSIQRVLGCALGRRVVPKQPKVDTLRSSLWLKKKKIASARHSFL